MYYGISFSQNAMQVIKFTKEHIQDVLSLLAAILHIGNVEFITAGGAQVKDMHSKYECDTHVITM